MLLAFLTIAVVPIKSPDRWQVHALSIYKCQYLAASNMQRVAERRQRRFVKGFAQRRMGVDGECDVFEPRAHLQGQREGAREFRDSLTDSLDAEHHMVVGARDNAHEALVVLQRHGAAIGAERKMADANFSVRRL